MKNQKKKMYRIAVLLVLLSTACLPICAEEICSREGRSKMLVAGVTEEQIAKICPAKTEQMQSKDQIKEQNLSKTPIGLYVEKVSTYGGMTYSDITVRNNSGKFIKSLYIEVLAYDNENRVGNTNHIFNSVNVGETMVTQNPINTNGRPWNAWRYSSNIH